MRLEDYFEDWELRHLKKRTRDFGLHAQRENLEDFIDGENSGLEKTLRRLSRIPGFQKTCQQHGCEVCSRVEKLFNNSPEEEPWKVDLELWRWQKQCKGAWLSNGGRGIIKVVTGEGKTILALSLISHMKIENYSEGGLKSVIVVPNTALLDQWYEEVQGVLNLEERDIGVYYGEDKDNIQGKDLMIYVLNSARKHLEDHLDEVEGDVFLVADECHRFASEKSAELFERTFDYTVGLSATPEREADFGFKEVLEPNLGEVIYEYNYSDAREDGIIPPFHLKRIEVPLQQDEEKKYDELTEKLNDLFKIIINRYPRLEEADNSDFLKTLGQLQSENDDDALENYTVLANLRKEIIHESKSKMAALRYIIDNEVSKDSRILMFHERKDSADQIQEFLQEEGYSSGIYHTDVSVSERRQTLEAYKDGDINTLVTCKALDEGLDVPDTDVGIIVAATSSVRQRIQRIGRILRKSPGKDYAQIYTVYIKDKEEDIFDRPQMKDLEKTADEVRLQKLEF